MAGKNGWVKIHRQIQESAIWLEDCPYDRRSAWIDLILMANHEDNQIIVNKRPLIVKRGQKFTSLRKLAIKWRWDRETVSRYIDLLIKLGMIEKCVTHNGTLLTIVNYDFFQGSCDTDATTDATTGVTPMPTQMPHKQEYKKVKNGKNLRKEDGAPLSDPWGNKFE